MRILIYYNCTCIGIYVVSHALLRTESGIGDAECLLTFKRYNVIMRLSRFGGRKYERIEKSYDLPGA